MPVGIKPHGLLKDEGHMATVKVEVCNLALSRCGSYGTVENIDTPTKNSEKICAKHWEISRQLALKTIMPNFAVSRRLLGRDAGVPAFGYAYQYSYPSDCLKILGIGNAEDKSKDYVIEAGSDGNQYIMTDLYDEDLSALPIRFISDVSDVSRFSPEFVDELSWFLAFNINMELTQDVQKQAYFDRLVAQKKNESMALNAQENPPVRINTNTFRMMRTTGISTRAGKL